MTIVDPAKLIDPASYRSFPLHPPGYYFKPPASMPRGQKLTVITAGMKDHDGKESPGRVYGYVAPWGTCLMDGRRGGPCLTAPPSPTAYAAALQGDAITAEGDVVKVANIGGGVNHVPIYPGEYSSKVVDHYANTASQTMRVVYGEDTFGIWAAGALWPDVDELTVARARAAALSGDWRWRQDFGAYDLAGAQMVNVPGYPLPRVAALPVSSGYPPLVGGMGGIPPEFLEEMHMRTVLLEHGGHTFSADVEDDAPTHAIAAALVAAVRSTPTCSCHGAGRVAAPASKAVGKVVEALLEDDTEEPAPAAADGSEPKEPTGDVPPGLAKFNAENPEGPPPAGSKQNPAPVMVDEEGEPLPGEEQPPGAPVPGAPPAPDAGMEPGGAMETTAEASQLKAQVAMQETRLTDLEGAILEQAGQIQTLNRWLANEAALGLDSELADLTEPAPQLNAPGNEYGTGVTPARPAEDKLHPDAAMGAPTAEPTEDPAVEVEVEGELKVEEPAADLAEVAAEVQEQPLGLVDGEEIETPLPPSAGGPPVGGPTTLAEEMAAEPIDDDDEEPAEPDDEKKKKAKAAAK